MTDEQKGPELVVDGRFGRNDGPNSGGRGGMPPNRSGVGIGPKRVPKENPYAAGAKTEMEKNAPVFATEKEFHQWLEGKPTRREVIADVKKLWGAMGHMFAMMEQYTEESIVVREILRDKGIIDPRTFQEAVTIQLNFKKLLDSMNFAQGMPMEMKVDQALSWNTEHPEKKIRGDFIKGLRDQLKDPASGWTLLRRAEIASELLIPEEEIMTPEELEKLAEELMAASVVAEVPAPEVAEVKE